MASLLVLNSRSSRRSSLGVAACAAEEIKRAWRAGRPADAAAVLQAKPSLGKFRSIVIDLVYEEFCLKWEAGDAPDPAELAAKFPAYRSSIMRVIEAHQLLADHPELLAPTDWPNPTEFVEGLEIVAELGRGAFGRAYLAYDPETARQCVLKLTSGGGAEARVMGRLRHPHITDVYWAKPVGNRTGVCMPLVGVTTLEHIREAVFGPDRTGTPSSTDLILDALDPERIVADQPLDPPLVPRGQPYHVGIAAIMARVAAALAHAHRLGITHADIKPSNIILGPGGHPYLIDFNLASVAAGPPGKAGGTLPYMAPEVLAALTERQPEQWPCPPSADVYSFGVTLFEMLTGRLPYPPEKGPTGHVASKLHASIQSQSAQIRRLAPQVPAGLAAVAQWCLAPDPKDRPADLDRVRDRLEAFTGRSRTSHPRTIRPLLAGAAALTLSITGWHLMPPAPHQESRPVAVTAEEHFTRGVQLLKAERLSEAQDALIQARFGTLAPRAMACLAYCYAQRGQTREGLSFSHLALSAGQDQAAVRNNLGYCLLESGKVAEALPQLEEAIRQDRTLRQAYYNRALARYLRDLSPDHTLPDRAAADDMRKALESMTHTVTTCLEAAQVFAATRPIAPELTADAIRCLTEGVRIGMNPSLLARTAVLQAHLSDHPEFQRLCAAPRQPLSEPPGAYLRFRLIAPE